MPGLWHSCFVQAATLTYAKAGALLSCKTVGAAHLRGQICGHILTYLLATPFSTCPQPARSDSPFCKAGIAGSFRVPWLIPEHVVHCTQGGIWCQKWSSSLKAEVKMFFGGWPEAPSTNVKSHNKMQLHMCVLSTEIRHDTISVQSNCTVENSLVLTSVFPKWHEHLGAVLVPPKVLHSRSLFICSLQVQRSPLLMSKIGVR